jgi:hypothetical protein
MQTCSLSSPEQTFVFLKWAEKQLPHPLPTGSLTCFEICIQILTHRLNLLKENLHRDVIVTSLMMAACFGSPNPPSTPWTSRVITRVPTDCPPALGTCVLPVSLLTHAVAITPNGLWQFSLPSLWPLLPSALLTAFILCVPQVAPKFFHCGTFSSSCTSKAPPKVTGNFSLTNNLAS